MKKILVVDDSTLMRRVMCDIINSDERFTVTDEARDGVEALELIKTKEYDAVVLDVNMPRMDGMQLLHTLRDEGIQAHVMMASTTTMDGASITMQALELGALDFIHKPEWSFKCKEDEFTKAFCNTLAAVCEAKLHAGTPAAKKSESGSKASLAKVHEIARKNAANITGNRIVALAVSTGGPKSLQSVIPFLPADLNAPVVMVQHMPVGFTASLADRLNSMSMIEVVEAKEGDVLKKGCVYIARGGAHMNLVRMGKQVAVHYTDEPSREGVKPCANYMYESLAGTDYDEVVCVVMTGMGADGTEGIVHLKEKKKTYCITQESSTCVVYGMPRAAVKAGVSNVEVPLSDIAQEIILHVGVTKNGC